MTTMIRNAVLHLMNEQPMIADLFEQPSASDQGLRCTNLRTLDGRRPVFIDDIASVFFFPYLHIRFVEIPPASLARPGKAATPEPTMALATTGQPEPDLEIDEDFLRRIREV